MPDHNIRKHVRMNVFIPCGILTSQPNIFQAWGKINNISFGGVELQTYFKLIKDQIIFLTFTVNERFIFTNVKSKILRVKEEDGYITIGVSFEEVIDKEHLKDALQSLLE